jgi:hypothetical protein
VDLVVDVYVEFNRTEPAAQVLSFGGPVDRHMLDPEDDNNAVVSRALGDVLRLVLPDLGDGPELQLALRVAVEAGDGVLDLAFRSDPAADPAVVAEAKRLIKAYLSGYLDR